MTYIIILCIFCLCHLCFHCSPHISQMWVEAICISQCLIFVSVVWTLNISIFRVSQNGRNLRCLNHFHKYLEVNKMFQVLEFYCHILSSKGRCHWVTNVFEFYWTRCSFYLWFVFASIISTLSNTNKLYEVTTELPCS